jgi:hypothetical protein
MGVTGHVLCIVLRLLVSVFCGVIWHINFFLFVQYHTTRLLYNALLQACT